MQESESKKGWNEIPEEIGGEMQDLRFNVTEELGIVRD